MAGDEVLPVVVIGAGPTGITAAVLLGQAGVDVLVLDRWHDVFPQPRAVHLDDEVFRVLDRVGVADEFAAISRPADGLRLLDSGHRALATFDRSGVAAASGHPRANMFDQPALEALLRRRARDLVVDGRRPVTVRGGVEVTGVVERDAGAVEVTLSEMATGEAETLRARYVLGADGANSLVRRSIGASMVDLGFDQRWLVVDVDTDVDLHLWGGVHQVCDSTRAATYMHVAGRRHRWEFQLLDGERSTDFGALDAVMPLMAPWLGHPSRGTTPASALELVRVAEYTFRAQVADRWRSAGPGRRGHGRTFLLGDAAHLTPPFVGQGMGAGVRDAANLAWKVAGVLDGRLPESVLDSYAPERSPHALGLVQLARTTGTVMTGGGRFGDLSRRVVAPALAWVPGVRARVVDSETPALRSSDWIVGRVGLRGDVLAGRLLPRLSGAADGADGPGELGAAGRFTLVSVQPVAPSVREFLTRHGCDVVEVDAGSFAGRWMEDGGATAVLVRPDSVVMVASTAVGDLVGTVASRMAHR